MPERVIFFCPGGNRAPMCRRRDNALASQPMPSRGTRSSTARSSDAAPSTASSLSVPSFPAATDTSSGVVAATTSSSWSASSIASLRTSLPEKPSIFSVAEIAAATNNFLAKPISSTSSSWRCQLRGRDTVVFQRRFHGDPAKLPSRFAAVCRSHHRSLVSLLGASLSADRIYLVYEFVQGSSLAECLRNPRNPTYTPLSSWISRMQVATDLAQGLEYIHHHAAGGGTIHNRIESSAIFVTEPQFNAKICHYGAAFLAGDIPDDNSESVSLKKLNRLNSHFRKIEGTRAYMAPELIAGGSVSLRSDVFAFGVVLLELITGEEPVKNTFNRVSKEYRSVSLIEMAREVIGASGLEDEDSPVTAKLDLAQERKRNIRQWVDKRLKDSFPVEVVEKLTGIALRCVEVDAEKRPSMTWVEGKVSKLFLDSKVWAERIRVPTDISISLTPR